MGSSKHGLSLVGAGVVCGVVCLCCDCVHVIVYMTMRVCAHKGQGDAGFQLPYFSHCF